MKLNYKDVLIPPKITDIDSRSKVNLESKYIGTWGANQKLYEALQKTPQGKKAQFRTYNWDQVRKSAVFFEPIKLPKKKVLLLAERQGIK